ncbi:cytochrome c [Roseimicrobium gellanilyticum]|uniref:Cytochrome c n=2 Tax=Roseimicrobium gellanilyticum TaxID=748857 RepID=A0A366HDE2_9BACT|nr:cytochrome c [Roseimicrobium gellanilyticum]
MPKFRSISLLLVTASLSPAWCAPLMAQAQPQAQVAQAQSERGKETFDKKVMPVLQQYCWDCHGDGMDKGNFALDKHADYKAMMADKKFWDNVREHVDTHVMPPENKDQPTNEERDAITKWIEDDVFWVDPKRPDPGHITLRRLNRVEYNNTIRDIFRVDSRPATAFPPDDTGYGYDNIGDVLSLSPLLMEKYMKAARKVAEDSIWTKPPTRLVRELGAGKFDDPNEISDRLEDQTRSIFSNGDIEARVEMPTAGVFRASLTVSATQAGPEKAKLAVLVDGKELRQLEVSADLNDASDSKKWQTFHFDLPMEKGQRKVAVRFLNDYFDEKEQDPKRKDRNVFLDSLDLRGPIRFQSGEQSKFLDWLCEGQRLQGRSLSLRGTDFDASGPGVGGDSSTVYLSGNGYVHRAVEIPEDGKYKVRLRVSANQAGPEKAKLKVNLGEMDFGVREIAVKSIDDSEEWVFEPVLKKGTHELRIEFLNDFYGGAGQDRNAVVQEVVVETTGDKKLLANRETVRKWIDMLGFRIFRRPLEQVDADKLNTMTDMVFADGGSAMDALKLVTEALLCSPKFLFRGGAEPMGVAENGSAPVDEFTLASRLSYFLWSSCPDEELLKLASAGELRKNLPAQVTRMIGDWKAYSMAENFAGQWLQLRNIDLVAPNRRLFPEFEGGIGGEMKRESLTYFDHIFRENRSVLEFLDSDYTFLNEKLARFYGIQGVKGKEFRKVSLEGTPRGGILTHGSVLTLTSHPNRTSPVKRGQFVLENILGTPPPPAPQNVPAFGEDRGRKVEGTLRQRFEAHRANPSCASCHAFLDPMGFALENYDAIGRWRDTDNRQPIDATGKLLTGQAFNGAKELRKVLVEARKNEFTKCLTENMLTYALGRGLDYPDKPFVKEMVKNSAASGYKFQDIVLGVIQSPPFQRMRVGGEGKKVAEGGTGGTVAK